MQFQVVVPTADSTETMLVLTASLYKHFIHI